SLSRYSPFLFACTDDLRALHSFPTRRSSDLDGLGHPGDSESLYLNAVALAVDGLGLGAAVAGRLLRLAPLPAEAAALVSLIDSQDRKSTRLNSSHLGISYAVFCLKKKSKGLH